MYVFFEHMKDESGNTLATQVYASSYKNKPGIHWKKDEIPMKLLVGLFKTPPFEQRMYNEPLKLWTYLGDAGKHLLEVVQDSFLKLNVDVTFYEIEGLEESVKNGAFPDMKMKEFDPKTFFYNQGVPAGPSITKETAIIKLAVLLGTGEKDLRDNPDKLMIKKLYRAKALAFHPDRNAGDGSKMSDLNMYWQVYNAS